MPRPRLLVSLCVFAVACAASSGSSTPPTTTTPAAEPVSPAQPAAKPATPRAPDHGGRGGRLFDKWYAEAKVPFKAGASGGPAGDGTLQNGEGTAMKDIGHAFRLKNFFGWDLRGADGVYGPKYQNKSYVVSRNLLSDERPRDELIAWLRDGDKDSPALGKALDLDDIERIADFVIAVRSKALPHPDAIWSLSTEAPKNYTLNEGGDPQRGQSLYEKACSGCHGDDGTNIPIDQVLSLGAFSRSKAYEGWFKILSGHPGTDMHREIEFTDPREGEQMILSILARLCDRQAFPAMPGHRDSDVPDGDPRCGAYLK